MLVRALGLFLLLDGGDDAPGSTSCANDVLVCDGEKVTLIDAEFAAHLGEVSLDEGRQSSCLAYVCNLLHVADHLIVALGLLAEPREEGLARRASEKPIKDHV